MRRLADALPQERFIFFSDEAKINRPLPLEKLTKQCIDDATRYARFLQSKGVKAIVIACNLMSALAGDELRLAMDVPVIDLLSSGIVGIRGAFNEPENIHLSVFTTKIAEEVDLFRKVFLVKAGMNYVIDHGCVELVKDLTIKDLDSKDYLLEIMKDNLKESDNAIYIACTRFSVLVNKLRDRSGEIPIIDPTEIMPSLLKSILMEKKLLASEENTVYCKIYTTGDSEETTKAAGKILGANCPFDVNRANFKRRGNEV